MKRLKKRVLATLLLAGVMSFGLLACGGKDGDGTGAGNGTEQGGGNGAVTGEQVSAEGWGSAFENTDITNVHIVGSYLEETDGLHGIDEMEYVYSPNAYYLYDKYTANYEGEQYIMESKYWQHQQGSYVYDYEMEDSTEGEWANAYSLYTFDIDDEFEMLCDMTGVSVEEYLTNYESFTYNSTKGVYCFNDTLEMEDVSMTYWIEVMFSAGKVYSIEYHVDYVDIETVLTVNIKMVFEAKTITLPAQDELNALIEANNNQQGGGDSGTITVSDLLGTYKFELQMTYQGGQLVNTMRPGDVVGGKDITEDYMSIGLNVNGTAYILIGISNMSAQGTWELNESDISITFMGSTQTFTYEDGKLINEVYEPEHGATAITYLVKTSTSVDPTDFIPSGGNGGGDIGGGDVGGGSTPGEPVKVAQYVLQSVELGGETYYLGDEFYDEILTETYYSLAFFSDGTAIYYWARVNEEECTWNKQGSTIILEGKNLGTVALEFNGDVLIMDNTSNRGAIITFVGEGFDVGDGGLGERGAYVGTYKFYYMETYQGTTYYVGDYFSNMNRLTEDYYSFVLNSDGTAYVIWQDNDMGACIWDVEAGEIVVKTDEGYDVTTLKVEGEYLVEEYKYNYKTYLEKVY